MHWHCWLLSALLVVRRLVKHPVTHAYSDQFNKEHLMDLFSLLFLLGLLGLGLGYTPLHFSLLSLAQLLTDTHNTSPLSSITPLW